MKTGLIDKCIFFLFFFFFSYLLPDEWLISLQQMYYTDGSIDKKPKISRRFRRKMKTTKIPSNNYTCSCGRAYKYANGLHQHRKYECGKEPSFRCDFCPFAAHLRSNLYAHVRRRHSKWMRSFGFGIKH